MKRDIEPRCVKLYLEDICILRDVPKAIQDTLYLILRKLDYDGCIYLTTSYRQQICEELNIVRRTLKDRIAILKKAKILHKKADGGRNEYLMNPYILARGSWNNVQKQRGKFEIRHTYDAENGKTTSFHTYIGDKEEKSSTLEEAFSDIIQTKDELLEAKEKQLQELKKEIIKLKAGETPTDQEVANQEATQEIVTQKVANQEEATDIILDQIQDFCNKDGTIELDAILRGFIIHTWLDRFLQDKNHNAINIDTCKRYVFKCFLNHLKDEKMFTKTQYKSTIERLTDYDWAKGLSFDD